MIGLHHSLTFFLVAGLFAFVEYRWRRKTGKGYDLGALGGTLGVAIGQKLAKVITGGGVAAVFFGVYSAAPVQWPLDDWRTWAAGFFALEFFYYWQHRFSHTIRWMWTSHSVHHSTNQFTLPAAARLGWTNAISGGWLVLLPLALLGLHPIAIGLLMALNLQYQYFIHTEAAPKLGPLEWVLNTPSHHRVHHGSNPEYLDKNYGGVLIIFDRLFATFAQERADTPVIYGLTKPVTSNNPFVIAFHEWGNLFRDLRGARSVSDKARALFGRPGAAGPAASITARPPTSSAPGAATQTAAHEDASNAAA